MSKRLSAKKIDEDFLMSFKNRLTNPAPLKQKIFNRCVAWTMNTFLNFWSDPVLACEVLFFTLARPIIKPKW